MAVRRERVVLELQDDFTTGMARAAAATALLDKELNHLSRDSVQSQKTTRAIERNVDDLGKTSGKSEKEIDKLSGRLKILGEVAAIVGPSLVPIGAVAVPAITGLASALGFAVLGAGSAALAFRGLGDAMNAVDKANLEPTVKNLQAAHEALALLAPDARAFVTELESMKPALDGLSASAAHGLFPGLTQGLEELKSAIPLVQNVVGHLASAVGDLGAAAGESIGSGKWNDFLVFLGTEGPKAIAKMASAAGNLAHGLAGLWMSTQPLNNDFLDWLDKATAKFGTWSNDLGSTKGFHDFMDYIHEIGPQVGETLGAIGNALVQVTEAIAPLGGPSLRIIEALANAISAIADSSIGTPLLGLVATLSTLSLATKAYGKAIGTGPVLQTRSLIGEMQTLRATGTGTWSALTTSSRSFVGPLTKAQASLEKTRTSLGKTALAAGGLAIATSGVADNMGASNTVSLALAGSLAGPWGAAISGSIGAVKDLSIALGESEGDLRSYQAALLMKAGPAVADQLKAVTEELKKQQAIFDDTQGPTFSLPIIGTVKPAENWMNTSTWRTAEDKVNALKETQANLRAELDKQATTTKYLTSLQGRQAAMADRQAAAMRAVRGEADRTTESFFNYNNELFAAGTSLDTFIKKMRDEAQAAIDLASNTAKAEEKGVRLGLIESLRSQGPAGALILKKLVEGTPADIKKANAAWRLHMKAIQANRVAAAELLTAMQTIANQKLNLKVNTHALDGAIGKANTLLGLLGQSGGLLNPGTKPPKDTNDPTLGGIFADGGLVAGPGGPRDDRILTRLSNREYVVNADAVSHYGVGMFDALNAKRFANGGSVGGLRDYIRSDLDLKYPRTLKQWDEALKASTSLLTKDTDQRQKLLDQAQGVRDAVSSNYRSGLFGQTSNVWMSAADRAKAGQGGAFSSLTGDIGRLQALQVAEKQLKGKGLDGGAFAELVSNGSLADVQAFAGGSKADVMRYEALYNKREKLLTSAGNYGANAAFGAQLATAQAQLVEARRYTAALGRVETLLKHNPHATGEAVGRAINGVGPKRPRKGN